AGHLQALLRWGAFGSSLAQDCGDDGLFVATPISMPNPAAWIRLAHPGWVDFGRGEVPTQLGIPVVDGLAIAEVAGGGHWGAGRVAPPVVDRYTGDPAFATAVQAFFGDRGDLVDQVFSTRHGWDRIASVSARDRDRDGRPAADPRPAF